MSSQITILRVMAALSLLAPWTAGAFTLSQVLGYLNIVIGLFLTVSIISYSTGMVIYWTRYGTWPREEGFPFMQFGITTLFVLSVLLALVHFVLKYTSTALYILSFVALLLCVILLTRVFRGKKEDKGAGRQGPPR